MHPAGISARLAAFLLRLSTPSRSPETSSDDFCFPLRSRSAYSPRSFTLYTRSLLCPPCFLRSRGLPRISAHSSLASCFFPSLVFHGFPVSHFLLPSAFASVRTSSARFAFYFSAFLLPMNLHSPSGTSNLPFALPVSHLFAFRPSFFRLGSLSRLLRSRLHPSDDFLSLQLFFRYSAALSCSLLFRALRPSGFLFPGTFVLSPSSFPCWLRLLRFRAATLITILSFFMFVKYFF